MKHDILSMNINELRTLVVELGHPVYRAVQIFEWLHRRLWAFPSVNAGACISDTPSFNATEGAAGLHPQFSAAGFYPQFSMMENLPKNLREALAATCRITPCTEAARQQSKDGTVKFLLECGGDGNAPVFIESVLMRYNHDYSLCISTQAGCRMGCKFCASAIGGLVRNLSAGEMCAQVYQAQRFISNEKIPRNVSGKTLRNASGEAARNISSGAPRISSVVMMGCGEPLDNFDASLRFIELITHEKGANLGTRHITLSTCGLIPEIRVLAQKQLQINLAVSLHGPSDEIRRQFMPVALRYPLEELLDACRFYADTTRRRVTFEYALAAGINDRPEHAHALAQLLRGIRCHVNLIPINKKGQEKSHFSPTPRAGVDAFAAVLNEANIPATVRRSLGSDITAACGQLRATAQAVPHKAGQEE